jgi:alcohol dehydrogenase class IV
MNFEFATATKIISGPGSLMKIKQEIVDLGKRVLIVTGKSDTHVNRLLECMNTPDLQVTSFHVPGEPTVEMIAAGVKLAKEHRAMWVVAIGGGSALDAGKAIAILLNNPKDIFNYLEVIGKAEPFSQPALPFIAVPTTSGTGTEVTRNAVLASPEHHVKVSLRSPMMLPRLAIVDAELTYGLPPAITASSGLDALTQLIEPYVSTLPNPITDAICRQGILYAAGSLREVYMDGSNKNARQSMSVVSLFGGLALANARLGAVHGFAGPFGGMFPAPHGMICAKLLPFVTEANVRALRGREPENPVIHRYQEVAEWLTGIDGATPEDGVEWLHKLCDDLSVPPLSEHGFRSIDIPGVVAKSSHSSSMKGNPIKLTEGEMGDILSRAL